jgi:hypothetical protein
MVAKLSSVSHFACRIFHDEKYVMFDFLPVIFDPDVQAHMPPV